jgi:hypothetical protein
MGHTERAYPRYAIDAAVEIRVGDGRALGRTRNLSRGGLCVDVDRPVAPGATVELSITLVFDDDRLSEPLSLGARVMWCTAVDDGHQLGCQFVGAMPRDLAYLDMFLRYLEARAQDDAAAAAPVERREEDPFA